jgi:hypothetical protein
VVAEEMKEEEAEEQVDAPIRVRVPSTTNECVKKATSGGAPLKEIWARNGRDSAPKGAAWERTPNIAMVIQVVKNFIIFRGAGN